MAGLRLLELGWLYICAGLAAVPCGLLRTPQAQLRAAMVQAGQEALGEVMACGRGTKVHWMRMHAKMTHNLPFDDPFLNAVEAFVTASRKACQTGVGCDLGKRIPAEWGQAPVSRVKASLMWIQEIDHEQELGHITLKWYRDHPVAKVGN
ncbi:hypothetical protein B0H14DRAFT_2627573 [Mycena olivaceomarginata]|nr:hypothetical protein B0H14DRAFT_2627573 [Mycena olivaceomarginata]